MILTGCIAGMVAALCTWTRRFLERENYETDALWQGRVQIKKHYNRGAGFGLPGLRGAGTDRRLLRCAFAFPGKWAAQPETLGDGVDSGRRFQQSVGEALPWPRAGLHLLSEGTRIFEALSLQSGGYFYFSRCNIVIAAPWEKIGTSLWRDLHRVFFPGNKICKGLLPDCKLTHPAKLCILSVLVRIIQLRKFSGMLDKF